MVINLNMFCADFDDPRYYLHKPFSDGDYSYATNGNLLVRVERVAGVEDFESHNNGKLPAKINSWLEGDRNYTDIPEHTKPEPRKCGDCGGTGRYYCPCCDGMSQCNLCEGAGKLERNPCMFDCSSNQGIAVPNMEKIESLPSIKIDLTQLDQGGQVFFRFDGGEGIVMPMTVERLPAQG